MAALRDAATGPDGPWRTLDVIAETGSTNTDLIARAATGADIAGAVLVAEYQAAGKGRNGRQWAAAPRAQLTVSAAVDAADVAPGSWGWLPLATGVAVVDAVSSVTGVDSGLKWPNDVLAKDGRKLAGILAEVASPQQTIVVGIGLNVTLTAAEVGESTAVSLLELGATSTDRNELLIRLLDELARRVSQWRSGDPQLAADYRARSVTIGQRVRGILPGDREVTGIATDVDDEGRLSIGTESGAVTVAAGDVVHLRT